MDEERSELAYRVFPFLKSRCEERGIPWSEVDLRWGITDEQKAEGKTLELCFAQIDRCRPFLIGLLGDRYGSIPQEIPADLLARERWLTEYQDRSVTELEILHAALNTPTQATYAFFYFRQSRTLSVLDLNQKKLTALKQRIRQSGLKLHDNYRTAHELAEMIIADFSAVIDSLAPKAAHTDPLARAAAEQEAFAQSRTDVYVGRDSDFARLHQHVLADGPPLVVIGAAGCGKTALLATWVLRQQREEKVCFHFITRGSSVREMLRRLLSELRLAFKLPPELRKGLGLRQEFEECLGSLRGKGRLILLLDGLDQLEERDGAHDLAWLPLDIPSEIRLVISTSGGRTFQKLVDRGWPIFEVAPFTIAERQSVIEAVLGAYGKSLPVELGTRIARSQSTALALYLRTLLDELRFHGDPSTLSELVDQYLAATRLDDLLVRVLRRYERDYERDRPSLVRDTMSALWAARQGLAEAELLELLGTDGERLPRSLWSPIYIASERGFLHHAGRLALQGYWRRAIQRHFLPTEVEQRRAHRLLAAYFSAQPTHARTLAELPWQLAAAEAWQELYHLLRRPSFFQALWIHNQFEARGFWAQLEARSSYRLQEAYRFVCMQRGHIDPHFATNVASLLAFGGHAQEALTIREWVVRHYQAAGKRGELADALNNLGLSYLGTGNLDLAHEVFKASETICRELNDGARLCLVLGNRAATLIREDDHERKLGITELLVSRQRKSRRLDEALVLLREQEELARELQDARALGMSLLNQGTVRFKCDDAGGIEPLRQAEALFLEIGDLGDLATCLLNQASMLILKRKSQAIGLSQLERSEQIYRELGDRAGLATVEVVRNAARAKIPNDGILDPLTEFVEFSEEELRLRQLGDDRKVIRAQLGQAKIRGALRDSVSRQRGLELYQEVARACSQLDDTEGLREALIAIGSLLLVTVTPLRIALPILAEGRKLARKQHQFFLWFALQGFRFFIVLLAPFPSLVARLINFIGSFLSKL